MAKPDFRFAFIADPQIGMARHFMWPADGPQSDAKRLEFAVNWINTNDVDFVIFGGDQINDPRKEEEFDLFMSCVDKLKKPWYAVAGNHDQLDPEGEPAVYTRRDGPNRFAFSHQGSFFVGFNSAWLKGDYGAEYQKREWDWLTARLQEKPADATHCFITMHHVLFATEPDEPNDYWNMPNRRELLELFMEHGVSCVLCGHWQNDADTNWRGLPLICGVGTAMPLQYPEELSFKDISVFQGGWQARRVSVEKF